MKSRFLKLCSSFLVIVLLVNMFPMGVFAQELQKSIAAAPEDRGEEIRPLVPLVPRDQYSTDG